MSRKGAFSLLVNYIEYISKSSIFATNRDLGIPTPTLEEREKEVLEIRIGRAAAVCNNTKKKILSAKLRDGTILLHISRQFDPTTFWPILLKIKMDELNRRQTAGDRITEHEHSILYKKHHQPIDAYTLYEDDGFYKPRKLISPGEFSPLPWERSDDAKQLFGGPLFRNAIERLVKNSPEFN